MTLKQILNTKYVGQRISKLYFLLMFCDHRLPYSTELIKVIQSNYVLNLFFMSMQLNHN